MGLGAKGEGRGPGACAPGLQRNMTAAAGKAISPLQQQDPPPLPPRSRGCMLPPLLLLVCGTTCPDSSCRLRGRLSAESFCTTLLVYKKTLSSQLCPPWLGSAVTLSAKVIHCFFIELFYNLPWGQLTQFFESGFLTSMQLFPKTHSLEGGQTHK